MEFDQMLYSRLTQDAWLAEMLATFGDRPAVFNLRAPPPEHPKWGDKQFPRIDYIIDYQGDPARQTSGRLTVNIWCDTHFGVEPELIDARLREILHASFAQADDSPYCVAWTRSDAFEMRTDGQAEIRTIGITMVFDMIAFPVQYTLYPDPVKAMNQWTKTVIPDAVVIGEDAFDGWYTPMRDKPVVYWRLAAQSVHERRHTVTWLNVTLEGHVYALNANDRLVNLTKINTAIALGNHVTMEDASPLFVREITVMPHLSFLAPGQIQVKARFGILQPDYANPPVQQPLDRIDILRNIVRGGMEKSEPTI